MAKGIDRDAQMNFRIDPEYTNLPNELMEEAMNIVDTIEKRRSGTDVINWEEKAEMDRISQQHGRGAPVGGSFYGADEDQSIITEAQGKSNNPKEQELMDDLAGIMGELEGYDDKR